MEAYIKKLEKKIRARYPRASINASWDGRSVFLTGDASSIEERYLIGAFFARQCKQQSGYKGLVNDITVAGKDEPPMKLPAVRDSALEGKETDVLIIGAGVVGCAIARELSRYALSITVVEKECDCAMQASSRNDGMIHPGFADSPKKIKGKLNVRGNRLYRRLDKELGFQTKWPGSFMLFRSPLLRLLVPAMHRRAAKNGVDGTIGYRSKKTVQKIEPFCAAKHYGGFWLPFSGIASPFKVTIAFAENAAHNGVSFFFETAVTGFEKNGSLISTVHTNRGTLKARLVINAAGVWSDKVAGFADDRFFSIHPRKGMDIILDKKMQRFQNTIVGIPNLLASSKKHSKGGGLVPCVEGNILIGPTAREVYDREDYSTDNEDDRMLVDQMKLNRMFSRNAVIAYYSGIRAATWEEDFIVEGSQKVPNLIHAAGIQSPGFAAAPAIAEDITAIALKRLEELTGAVPGLNTAFSPFRSAPLETASMAEADLHKLIERDPCYGTIVCRCEQISEGEIRDAVRSCMRIGMKHISVDAVKRRCRAGMGRCHGGFCTPRVMEIIGNETGMPLEKITKKGGVSYILAAPVINAAAYPMMDTSPIAGLQKDTVL